MAALTRIAAASLALAVPIVAPAQDAPQAAHPPFRTSPAVERWRPYIAEASQRFGIPQAWIAAVMQAESAGQTHRNGRPITSHAGAMGLMQVMPGTWAALRRQHGLGSDPHDPRDNILAGAAYLKAMHDQFGYPGLFAAYNTGPARYAEHLRHRQTASGRDARLYRPARADPGNPVDAARDAVGNTAVLRAWRCGNRIARCTIRP